MQRLEAFGKVWQHSPPQHVSLARITMLLKAFMGAKDKESVDEEAANRLMNLPETEE